MREVAPEQAPEPDINLEQTADEFDPELVRFTNGQEVRVKSNTTGEIGDWTFKGFAEGQAIVITPDGKGVKSISKEELLAHNPEIDIELPLN